MDPEALNDLAGDGGPSYPLVAAHPGRTPEECSTVQLTDKYVKQKLAGSGSFGNAWIVKRSFVSITEEETDLLSVGTLKADKTPQLQEEEKRFYSTTGRRKKFIAKEIMIDNKDGDLEKLKRRTALADSEVAILSRLRHPNIIEYVEEIQEWDRTYIVMEYASGGDLKRFIHKRKKKHEAAVAAGTVGLGGLHGAHFSEVEILNLFLQLTMGLKHVHGCGMLHRDIKPANLFLTSDHRVVKIGDFGLTKEVGTESGRTSTQCGTPSNYAPELVKASSYSSKVDMWAAGCILHELMTLEHPFAGGSRDEVSDRILSGHVPDPNPNKLYSTSLTNLCLELLQQNPRNRPAASDVLLYPIMTAALERLAEEEYQERREKEIEKEHAQEEALRQLQVQNAALYGSGREPTAEYVEKPQTAEPETKATPPPIRGSSPGGGRNRSPRQVVLSDQSPMAHVRAEQQRKDQATKDRILANSPGRRGTSPSFGTSPRGEQGGGDKLPYLPGPPPRSPRGGGNDGGRISPRHAGGHSPGGVSPRGGGGNDSSDDEGEEERHMHRANSRKFMQQELALRNTSPAKGGVSPTRHTQGGDGHSNTSPSRLPAVPSSGGGTTPPRKPSVTNAMTRSEFDFWLNKKVADSQKRKKVRDLIASVPTAPAATTSPGRSPGRRGSSPSRGTRQPVIPKYEMSVHRRCEIFDKCVDELNDFYNQTVHMTLMAIVFG